MIQPKRIVVLASGTGTNFRALVQAVQSARINHADFVALIVDRPNTGAQKLAGDFGIETVVVDYADFSDRHSFDTAIQSAIDRFSPDLIVAAGYMRILAAPLIHTYKNKILNIHPSLLPAFQGLHAQRQAFEYGVKIAGCTVHFVDEGLDTGPIVVQRAVNLVDLSVTSDLDEKKVTDLIRSVEHDAFIEAVSLFCEDRLVVEGRRVLVLPQRQG